MTLFNLPDLGEGLMDAEIREWHVKVGDVVKVDQALVCMETAKAVVEVPSPIAGRVKKLYGEVGALIQTGAALVEFEPDVAAGADKGSVVGSLEQSSERLENDVVMMGSAKQASAAKIKAMPAVRLLAQQLHVDLNLVIATGPQGQITADDVKKAAGTVEAGSGMEALQGVRRAMAQVMTQSHQDIVPVTLTENADVTDMPEKSDMTARIMQAMIAGIQKEPALNAWFDTKTMARRLFKEIHLGLAMDTEAGLFVPVLKNIEKGTAIEWRTQIEAYKKSVSARTIAASDLQGATISLSNFGMITGLYATPIIVPPMVSILACGKMREIVGVHQGQIQVRRILPLSLSFDHRAVTGGEATRFLGAVIASLEGAS